MRPGITLTAWGINLISSADVDSIETAGFVVEISAYNAEWQVVRANIDGQGGTYDRRVIELAPSRASARSYAFTYVINHVGTKEDI